MELALLVWFAGISEGLRLAMVVVGFIVTAIVVVGYSIWNIVYAADSDTPKPPKKRYAIPTISLCVIMWIVGLVIPDQKTVYMATGAYLGQEVVQSETVNKIIKIMNNKLDIYLKETEEELKK